jgi:contactin associated protein-like 2
VCHISEYPLSCLDYKMTRLQQRIAFDTERQLMIDVDGSGPIEPFMVTCMFGSMNENMNITQLPHYSEGDITVKGYRAPGSYSQNIIYTATHEQINELVERSYSCSQYVRVRCRGARFLNYFGDPYGWWTGRTNQPMYYWGDSEVGIRKCKCGVNQDCEYPNVYCNCDAGDLTREREDSGLLRNKAYLPVYKVNFGDTGDVSENRYIKYNIGKIFNAQKFYIHRFFFK